MFMDTGTCKIGFSFEGNVFSSEVDPKWLFLDADLASFLISDRYLDPN
jgi:hypothetical protein